MFEKIANYKTKSEKIYIQGLKNQTAISKGYEK